MLCGLRASAGIAAKGPTAGVSTIRKLEAAGVTSMSQLREMTVDAMVAAGVQKRFAKQIRAYVNRRMR